MTPDQRPTETQQPSDHPRYSRGIPRVQYSDQTPRERQPTTWQTVAVLAIVCGTIVAIVWIVQ